MTTREKLLGYGVQDRQLANSERWMSLACLFFFGFTTVYSLFKVGPVMTTVGEALGMGIDTIGYINTAFTAAAAIFAFPGAWIMRNVGVKFSLLITAIITFIGSALCLITSSPAVFLVARFLEGMGFGLIAVIGPNVMLRLFPPDRMGLVMGIWSNWLPVGTIIAFFSTPVLFEGFGWRSLWVVSIVLEIVMIIWLIASCKLPKVPENVLAQQDDVHEKPIARKVFMGSAVLVSLTFFFWNFAYGGAVNGFYPTFLQTVKGMSVWDSSFVTVLVAVITVPMGVIFGIVSDKTQSRKWFVFVAYVVLAIMAATFMFTDTPETTSPWIFSIIMGFVAAAVPMGTRSYIPILASEPRKADYALAIMAFVTGLGMMGSGFIGTVVASYGYSGMSMLLIVPSCVIAAIMILVSKSDRAAIRENEALLKERQD